MRVIGPWFLSQPQPFSRHSESLRSLAPLMHCSKKLSLRQADAVNRLEERQQRFFHGFVSWGRLQKCDFDGKHDGKPRDLGAACFHRRRTHIPHLTVFWVCPFSEQFHCQTNLTCRWMSEAAKRYNICIVISSTYGDTSHSHLFRWSISSGKQPRPTFYVECRAPWHFEHLFDGLLRQRWW